ncbi:MAG TPA: response regulator, partial [Nitrospirota bacterium]|nr:response regulator [Nitrospirota bacterium]
MPIKILLADKSITIQKVVEMLFSGKEYEVLCVSDGETAFSEAQRIMPDVVLADIDLPRIDGYSFAARLKQETALARTPVILMMSRDDIFDANRASQASVVDHIAKPFESQELIGKVRKAVSATSPRPAEPTAAARPSAAQPQRPTAAPTAPSPSVVSTKSATGTAPKQAPPADIFDIIQEAPTHADLKRMSPPPSEEEGVYEVEPVVEIEEQPLAHEVERALPVGDKAMEEMRAGLGLGGKAEEAQPEIVNFESLDMATAAAGEYQPHQAPPRHPVPDSFVPREYVPPPPERGTTAPVAAMSEERLRSIA